MSTSLNNKWRDRARNQLRFIIHKNNCRGDKMDAVVANPLFDIRTITRPELYLDAATIDKHFAYLDQRVGAIPSHASLRFVRSAARRLVQRIGRQTTRQIEVPANAIAEAWFFPVWTELCTLIPIRHLARHIAKLAGGDPVLVPIQGKCGNYLSHWHRSSIEPLILVSELKRAGATAALVVHGVAWPAAATIAGRFTLAFEPNNSWLQPRPRRDSPSPVRQVTPGGGNAVVLSGMRNSKRVLTKIDDPLILQSSFSPRKPKFQETLLRNAAPLPTVKLEFARRPKEGLPPGPLRCFSCNLPHITLGDWLLHTIGARTKSLAEQARRLVAQYAIEEAHVCDHLFFESALVAHAVREAGGRIIVWPHSSNAVHVNERDSRQPDHVNCITKASTEMWKARFKDIDSTILSDLMLTPCTEPRKFDPEKSITVVVLAGSHNLLRVPAVDVAAHKESYRRLFFGLSAMAPHVKFLCKAKAPWEPIAWLRTLAPPGVRLEETRDSPTVIDCPNLIFVTVSFGSSALLEGLGRGIPSMIVRDTTVEDYAAIDPSAIPIGPVDTVLAEVRKCIDATHYSEVTERQLEWYNNQTRFDATDNPSTPSRSPAG